MPKINNKTDKDNRFDNELHVQFIELAQAAKNGFSIDVSSEKMMLEAKYRALVLKELYQLNSSVITGLIDNINVLLQQKSQQDHGYHQRSDKLPQVLPAINENKVKKSKQPFYLVAFSITLVMLISGLLFFNQPTLITNHQTAPIMGSVDVMDKNTASTVVPENTITTLTLPVDNAELAFRLHGSNTIGEKLAPALLEAYLTEQGISEFYWREGQQKVEKTLQYIKNNQVYAIELHAHGSSTAFSDLTLGKADFGMASRRIKNTEVKGLLPLLGDLSQVGNEHIIGLDGLAIIVNQNNPVKHISTQTLARIFSGEVNNWSQLGFADQPINVYARDVNSGTWDTFKSLVLKKFDLKLLPTAIRLESSSELSTKISQDEYSIGFIGLNYIQHNKALAISEGKGTKATFPTRFTIGTEDYALSRRLYLYTPTSASEMVKDFAQFAISNKGQYIVGKTGLISQNIRVERVYPTEGAPNQYNDLTKKGQRLSLNFRFNYGENDLDNKGKRDLDRLIHFMEDNAGRRLVLMGFSDSIGAKIKNQQLSFERAKSVENELVARGIPVMSVEGFGEAMPIANNETEDGRERNRRVEVWVL